MTLPEKPLSRQEQYLNKIATGEGELPIQPLSRVEHYLAYICENGGVGGSGGLATDLGLIGGLGDFGNIANLPTNIISDKAFVAYKHKNGYAMFTQDFIIDTSGINMKEYYYKDKIVDWDFSGCSRKTPTSYTKDYMSNITNIITNSTSVLNLLVSVGFSADIIICTQDENSKPLELQQVRGTESEIAFYTGKQGQIVINTDDNSIHVMDGLTAGGHKISSASVISQVNITDLEERVLMLENIINTMQL